jgi:hypothetical protein
MILDPSGTPIRRRVNIDGFQLPNGAIVSVKATLDFNRRIQNDPKLREALEAAQKRTKRTFFHMDLLALRTGELTQDNADALIAGQAGAEEIMRERVETEKLRLSGKAYESATV